MFSLSFILLSALCACAKRYLTRLNGYSRKRAFIKFLAYKGMGGRGGGIFIYKAIFMSPSAVFFSRKFFIQSTTSSNNFFVWNRSWLCTIDKSYCSRWYDSYQAFQCNMILLAWIKGTFNGEEGLGKKSSVQSIMHRIIGYIRFRHTFI